MLCCRRCEQRRVFICWVWVIHKSLTFSLLYSLICCCCCCCCFCVWIRAPSPGYQQQGGMGMGGMQQQQQQLGGGGGHMVDGSNTTLASHHQHSPSLNSSSHTMRSGSLTRPMSPSPSLTSDKVEQDFQVSERFNSIRFTIQDTLGALG